MKRVVVVGLGREFRGDDAVGLRAVERWVEKFGQATDHLDVKAVQLETCGPELLAVLQGTEAAVLVDAVRGAGQVGSLHLLDTADLAAFNVGSGTAHGWGVAETLAMARAINRESVPPQMVVLGIEVDGVAVGSGLSAPVVCALEPAANLIERLVRAALTEPAGRRLGSSSG